MMQYFTLATLLPRAWVLAILHRKNVFEIRYELAQKWSQKLLKTLKCQIEVIGLEGVPKEETLYFISNHQGVIDPAVIAATSPVPMSFISKEENRKLPVLGSWAKTLDVIHFKRENYEDAIYMLREASRYLKKKRNLLIFPEGTRSKSNRMNEFKEGALQPAYITKTTIVPIVLIDAYAVKIGNNKQEKVKIIYGKPMRHEEYKQYTHVELSHILQNRMKELLG